jgi:hypothetical protein
MTDERANLGGRRRVNGCSGIFDLLAGEVFCLNAPLNSARYARGARMRSVDLMLDDHIMNSSLRQRCMKRIQNIGEAFVELILRHGGSITLLEPQRNTGDLRQTTSNQNTRLYRYTGKERRKGSGSSLDSRWRFGVVTFSALEGK